jgi:hypothetical protein
LGILDSIFRAKRAQHPSPGDAGPMLTPEQMAFWEANGYLVLPGWMSPDDIATVKSVLDDEWKRAAGNDHEVDMLPGAARR